MILKKPMELKRTSLYKRCLSAGGKMTPFAGWEMSVQFTGLIKEHESVRANAGMFEISHMGIFILEGINCKRNFQKLVPTDLYRIGAGEACYTVLVNHNGGIIDDLIVYDLGFNNNKESLLIVINAGCTLSDLTWIKQNLNTKEVVITDAKKTDILIAIQGPNAQELLNKFCNESLNSIPRFLHKKIHL